MNTFLKSSIIILITIITGCAATGQDLRANTYNATELNQNQEVMSVKIISIMPAKINIDNSKQKKHAMVAGGLLGAVAGGVAGNYLGNNTGAALGGLAGGATGVATGSLVNNKVMVDGVTLAYQIDGALQSSTQVGFACEYKTGIAIMVKTSDNNTRIQPNATCPTKS
ncbi:hypothetical protein BJAS_P4089 [Bathymodiolus japonicus methanotrophic gill symbiont]|uniref:hypothetical protein n=1 Tax=Bathymodiolus japonicus methanotrophic gill symbiont TaxID=113269 RepID=UPI001B492836|nr:hypothetical protein [Bathymodiolus japonicus methanotrophic gill symbiont]GFO73333.1 hypothetical protein BJAS_P4089 [Bathymodiolus japonicus methanotrophic gill symbiont]